MVDCKCGRPIHPAYSGTRCEDCYADGQERTTGRTIDDPTDFPDDAAIARRAKAGRNIWTGIARGSARRQDESQARAAEALRLRQEGYVFSKIGDRLGVSAQAAKGMVERAARKAGTTLPDWKTAPERVKRSAKGEQAERRRTDRAALAVRLRADGLSLNAIGRQLGVTASAVFSLLKRDEARRAEAAAAVDAQAG